jgi:uncharacterized lipoprotein YajG
MKTNVKQVVMASVIILIVVFLIAGCSSSNFNIIHKIQE